ncbi:GAF domain-containing protein [Deinococcus sp. Arct2-2]|uniref:ATP-binding protein n=1 Tax=Deinococcus sp. Arct2-2 TaxID=2568653 RepID=UPI0010A32414|nr:ATP-binding protein [Deinococcus sp. Arct2-2]THF68326.1 GAF domain-containing protein [Deinococcus sp. Arct2-2]
MFEPFQGAPGQSEQAVPAGSASSLSTTHLQGWWHLTQALSTAQTPQHVTDAVVQEGIGAMGAQAGSVMLLGQDGTALNIAAFSGYTLAQVEPWRVLSLDRTTPATQAIKQSQALFIETKQQALLDYPLLQDALQQFSGSIVVLPLVVQDQRLGVLSLSFDAQRLFSEVDRLYLLSLASQCAQALQRTTALQEAHILNDRLAFLAEASEILSGSLDMTVTLNTIAQLAVPRLADWCVISLPTPDGLLVPVTVVHQDPAMVDLLRQFIARNPVEITAENGSGRVFLTNVPELVPVVTDEMYDVIPQPEDWKAEVRRLQLRSVITVPMRSRGRVVGVLGMARTSLDRVYGPADLTFALEVAARSGAAVENASLYGQAQQEVLMRTQAQQELDAALLLLEERVKERTHELEQVNGELEAFAYSASHDLRTPIRHITSFAQLLNRHLQVSDPRASRLLDQIQQAATRLTATVDGILSLSKSSRLPLQVEAVDLNAVVRDVVRGLAAFHPDRVIDWQLAPLPVVQGDAALLQLALQNLLDNAVKYTQFQPEALIQVAAQEEDGEYLVTVRDNGVGFEAEYAHKLFEAFQRLHHPAEFEGTGIGLANVRRIVGRHGGRVWAESEPGQGACFSLSLPKRA